MVRTLVFNVIFTIFVCPYVFGAAYKSSSHESVVKRCCRDGRDGKDGESVMGPRGPIGPKGDKGANGKDGKDGARGPQGPPGKCEDSKLMETLDLFKRKVS